MTEYLNAEAEIWAGHNMIEYEQFIEWFLIIKSYIFINLSFFFFSRFLLLICSRLDFGFPFVLEIIISDFHWIWKAVLDLGHIVI